MADSILGTISPAPTLGSRIKGLRTLQHLSLRQLAERASVTPSYLSAVERGKLSPTIALLSKVLAALGTDLAAFFTAAQAEEAEIVFRQEAMQTVEDSGRQYTFIFPKRPDLRLEVLDERLLPGEEPEFEELPVDLAGYVLHGTLLLEVAGRTPEAVPAGDAFYVPAGRPVRGRCADDTPVQLLTMMTPPRY
ncbi:MAG: HTH-type transcriptional regulator PuuR [bacterium ADurb.Bin429]|nr:MAG: HTH-type transcriptional regulator PuuR [bacterium ADurb.Bin429]